MNEESRPKPAPQTHAAKRKITQSVPAEKGPAKEHHRPELGERAGSNTTTQAIKATRRIAYLTAERAGLGVVIELAVRQLTAGEPTVDVIGDLRRRLDFLAHFATQPYQSPDERRPHVEPDRTGVRGLSPAMRRQLARDDAWYQASAWWQEDRSAVAA